jgi:hypothetical protein
MATFVENNFVKMTSTFTAEKMARMLTNEMMLDRNEVNSDLVFICEDKELAYPKEVMSLVFPLIKDLLPSSRGCCDLYLRKKDAKIYITLADVEADSFEKCNDCIYSCLCGSHLESVQEGKGEIRYQFRQCSMWGVSLMEIY